MLIIDRRVGGWLDMERMVCCENSIGEQLENDGVWTYCGSDPHFEAGGESAG